jgi:putative nucleotidyltransferase with HDIG domain
LTPDPETELAAILDQVQDMPSLSPVLARLTALIASPDTTANDITLAISRDPGLVTRVLKLVNSAYYGFTRRISTITSAVVILGFKQIRNMALSSFVFDNFVNIASPRFDINGLWRHSLGVATFAAAVARLVAPRNIEDIFICGLLHDLGKFVLFRSDPEKAVRIFELAERDNLPFLAAENRLSAYDHARLGAAATERWKLPSSVVEVIRFHHAPLKAPEASSLPTAVINFADIMARSLLMGEGGGKRVEILSPEIWGRIGLSWPSVEKISRQAAKDYVDAAAFYA